MAKLSMKLSDEHFVTFDEQDAWILQTTWYLHQGAYTKYAIGNWKNGKLELMHRVILGYDGPLDIDHIDGNGLNNCRDNLRVVTRNVNNYNQYRHKMSNLKRRQLSDGSLIYDVRVATNGKSHHLGTVRSQWAGRLLAHANVQRILEGKTIVAFKRKHRFAPIQRTEIHHDFVGVKQVWNADELV